MHSNSKYYCQHNVKCAFLRDKKNKKMISIIIAYTWGGGQIAICVHGGGGGVHEKKLGTTAIEKTQVHHIIN